MSWSRGSSIMSDPLAAAKSRNKNNYNRYTLYTLLIPVFEKYDCDTLHECEDEDESFKRAMYDMHLPKGKVRKGCPVW